MQPNPETFTQSDICLTHTNSYNEHGPWGEMEITRVTKKDMTMKARTLQLTRWRIERDLLSEGATKLTNELVRPTEQDTSMKTNY